jgi:hypothetical protein
MIKENILYIGGNKFKYRLGNKLKSIGENLINKGKVKVVTNPNCKLVNPFTLIVSFTLDNTEKYQVVVQGDYKKHYKESEDYVPDVTEKEMLMIIDSNKNGWFKKE